MSEPSPDEPTGVVAAFLDRYLSDQQKGHVRDLADYQRSFPGYESVIAREFASLREPGDEPDTPPTGELPTELRRFGPYTILREIGRGGQGFVYLAEDPRLDRRVALKVLSAAAAGSEIMRSRLLREAAAASRIDHPAICTVFEVGEEDGLPYIAMQFVEGDSLARRIARVKTAREESDDVRSPAASAVETAWDIPCVLRLMEAIARALHHAHECGLVHRDVKPGNIMLTATGDPVVLDFGLARDEDGDSTLTLSGQLTGTPAYMAPEQIAAQRVPVDRRADVYALGVTLFECLTLRRPFEEATRERLYQRIMVSPPPDPRTIDRAISRDLCAVLEVALDKDPDRRYQTAAAFADDLRRIRCHEPILARRPGPVLRLRRWVRRRPAVAALTLTLGVCVPLLAGVGGYLVANLDEIDEAEAARRDARFEQLLVDGFARAVMADPERGIGMHREALRLRPGSVEAIAGLAMLHLRAGELDAARQVLAEHGADVDGDPTFLVVRAMIEWKAGRIQDADSLLAEWRAGPRTAFGSYVGSLLALWAFTSGVRADSVADALEQIEQAVLLAPETRQLYYVSYGPIAANAGDHDAARRVADAMVELWPDSYVAWCTRGYTLRNIGELEAAAAALRRALEIAPGDALALLNLGQTLEPAGDVDDAIDCCRRAVAAAPDWPVGHYNLACMLGRHGHDEEAEHHYREAIRLRPSYAKAKVNLGNFLHSRGRTDAAEEQLRDAVATRPGFLHAHLNLGVSLLMRGELDDAIVQLRAALRADPDHAAANYNIALALSGKGEFQAAIEHCRRALQLRPDHAEAHCNLGQFLLQELRFGEALRHLRRGHDLGRERGDWSYPSESWLHDAETMLIQAAHRAANEGFAVTPPADESEEAARHAQRRSALEWLGTLVDAWQQDLAGGSRRTDVASRVAGLAADPLWSELRSERCLARLPWPERGEWRALWAGFTELEAKAGPDDGR